MGNNIAYFAYLLLIMKVASPQTFALNLNHSLLLLPNATINHVSKDYENQFLVAFSNGQVRRYSPNLTSYTEFTFPEMIDQFTSRGYAVSATLSNGSSFSMNERVLVSRSNNLTTIRNYNYYSYVNGDTYHFNETIISEVGFPFKVAGTTRIFHIIMTASSIYVVYIGNTVTIKTWSSIFGAGVTCITVLAASFPMPTSGDVIMADFYYFVSMSNNQVHVLNMKLNFTFDFSINHYNASTVSYGSWRIFTSPSPITLLRATNGLLMMQSNTTGVTTICEASTSTIGITTNIPLNQTMNFFYLSGTYYLVQSIGIYKLNYNSTNRNLSLNSLLTTLPDDMYSNNFGSQLTLFYTPGKSYIYKGGLCTGQSYISGSSCVPYNCTVSNCTYCYIAPSICTVCEEAYTLENTTYTCLPSPTQAQPQTAQPSFSFFNSTMAYYSISILTQMISIPAARKFISPAFVYFGVFDDLYLYQFHDRLYGATINDLFSNLNGIQTKKWSFINYQKILDFLNIDSTSFVKLTDYQEAYDKFHFSDEDHVDVGSEGLWANCQNYFLVTIPITLLGFIVFRVLFRLLYSYPISKLIRKFDFWPFLLVILLEGNVQQLAFYLVTDWKNMFSFGVGNKLLKFYCVLFGFGVVLCSASLYFISYHLYAKLNKHLTENNTNDMKGILMLVCQSGLKNLILGITHSILRGLQYYHMLTIIIGLQMVFNCILVVSISMGVYRVTAKMWFYILMNLIKLVIIATLFVDYRSINFPIIETTQQMLIILEVLIFSVGVAYETVLAMLEMMALAKEILCRREIQVLQRKDSRCLKDELSRNGILVYVSNINGNKEIVRPSAASLLVPNLNELKLDQKCKKFKVGRASKALNPPKSSPLNVHVVPNTHRISFNIRYVTRKLNNILGKKE